MPSIGLLIKPTAMKKLISLLAKIHADTMNKKEYATFKTVTNWFPCFSVCPVHGANKALIQQYLHILVTWFPSYVIALYT